MDTGTEHGDRGSGAREEREPDSPEYVKEAFGWQYNLIGLAGAAAFALVSGSALPLLLAAGLELIYLSTVPQMGRFRRLVRSRRYAEEKRRREQSLVAMLRELPPDVRKRYADLAQVSAAVRSNYGQLSSTSQMLVAQMEQKLQGLLQSYLRLLHASNQHEQYLRQTDDDSIRREVTAIERRLSADAPRVQEINRQRIEILGKRLEKFEKIRENRQVIAAQCAAIADMLELIRDQSVTMRDPQELSDRLEHLARDVEQTEETVRQVETIYQLATPEMEDTVVPLPAPSPTPPSRSATGRRARS
jgi:uncharacterized protein YukE